MVVLDREREREREREIEREKHRTIKMTPLEADNENKSSTK